ncbi:MAG: hypothetical protein HW421_3296 [Ignavibacteria bacterium]|nr:hypothetical protein [Ignavibacteria bacterium]
MAVALKYEIFNSLVKEFGDSKAKLLNDFVGEVTNEIEERSKKSNIELKYEVRDDLLKELATKQELLQVRTEMELLRTELKSDNAKLNQKFNFMIILLIIALTLMNPIVAKIIQNLFKI